MNFKDHFSKQAADYAKFRPTYPEQLFSYLASIAPARNLAWDCATGNGQAAIGLASHFAHVIATDASERQIANAQAHKKVEYRVVPADQSGIESGTIDLVTVAQALHWFDLDAFYAEARRVLCKGGVIAVWGYQLTTITPAVDAIVDHYYNDIVGPFWPLERQIIIGGFEQLSFPFAEMAAPNFAMAVQWSREQLLGYLRTWSATQRFQAARGSDPIELIAPQLAETWPEPEEKKQVSWPLTMRIGHVS